MFKLTVVLFLACFVVNEARPKWQYLPSVPGYVPVYIQTGDTPLDLIHPELAAAFHAVPAGRSASKQIEASSDEQPEPALEETAESVVEAEETAAKAEETAVEAEETAVKAKETAVMAEETAVKAQESAAKAEIPAEKLEEPKKNPVLLQIVEPVEYIEKDQGDTKKIVEAAEELMHNVHGAKKVQEKKKVSSEVA